MKKTAILIATFLFIVGMSFAQEPQKPVTKTEPAKTEQTDKSKTDCAKKTDCSKAKTSSSCCSHGKPAAKPAKEDPGKK
ncbi:MAG: hypothetical protein IH596_12935 [Bacteroidales bacterium]|nr:hypothetical protein [Bacteroidales bacterium]